MALKKNKLGEIKDTQENRKKLKDKAWNTFSIYIRLRDKKCVACGATFWDSEKGEWSIVGLQAGHFHHNVLDFDEENVNAECSQCNHYKSGNLAPYSVYLLNKLGKKGFNDLAIRAKQALKGELLSIKDYQEIILKYEERIRQIKRT